MATTCAFPAKSILRYRYVGVSKLRELNATKLKEQIDDRSCIQETTILRFQCSFPTRGTRRCGLSFSLC